MDRRGFLASVASGLSVGLAGCAGIGGSRTPTPGYDIGMTASAFTPADYETRVGDTVTWRNTNSRAHTVTAYEAAIPDDAVYFASGGFDTEQAARDAFWANFGGAIPGNSGATYEHTFDTPGTYEYFCVPHEQGGMVGTITVRE